MVQRPERLAGVREKNVLVIDVPGCREGFSKTGLPSQNGQRARAQMNPAIVASPRLIRIDAGMEVRAGIDSLHVLNRDTPEIVCRRELACRLQSRSNPLMPLGDSRLISRSTRGLSGGAKSERTDKLESHV